MPMNNGREASRGAREIGFGVRDWRAMVIASSGSSSSSWRSRGDFVGGVGIGSFDRKEWMGLEWMGKTVINKKESGASVGVP